MFGLKIFKYLLKIPTIILCVAFVVLNMQDTTLYYSPITSPVTLPLWLLGLTLFTFGFVVGSLLVWLNEHPNRKELRQLRKDLISTQKEREDLEDTIRDHRDHALQNLDNKTL